MELPEELDVADWSMRHQRGEVPDQTPYGLHQVADDDVHIGFREPLAGRVLGTLATKVRNRLDGTEVVAAALGVTRPERRHADVVLCMDERTGLPAALLPGGPPVVSGIAWLEHPALIGRTHARLARQALGRMAAAFTQTPGLAPVLARAWDLPAHRVHEITLGIDTVFYPEQPWPDDTGVVAGVGDDRMRDHATLIAAVRQLRAAGTPARLELATTQRIELPADLGVLHARRMGAAVRQMYQRAGVVAVALHPNQVGSGLTVALEAMASGRPIVITRNLGVDHYVEHGVTGLLVPPRDTAALADAIGQLLADPARAEAMGRAGRVAVEKRFTSRHMADDLRRVLRTAVGHRPGH